MPEPTTHNLPFLAQTLNRSTFPLIAHAISLVVFLLFARFSDHINFRHAGAVGVILATLPLFFLVLTFVFNIISIYDYTSALALHPSTHSILRLLAFFPILGFLTAASLRLQATRILRSAGATVTLKGVSPEGIAALSQNCEHCGYSREGIPRASPCPECGQHLAA